MLSEFDRRFHLLPHFDIETIPLRMLPPQEAETFWASQSAKTPQTSTKRGKATRDFDFANPPEKLTWVLTDADNGEWNPYFEGVMVPEKLKKEWAKEFHSVSGNM
ncbi:hypothetical protein Pyn_03414 [Prunus yedoensis var. nudiflora]|uniref:Uncharacterized protein n=1 Tax=Prunus yedoensis var. nudiflora TaxID=2094558 RepID=A0A314YYN7_PRUYE|nr:hypothetical protein Pyn_03414 [Prunus yedoensis var. nudiflora]